LTLVPDGVSDVAACQHYVNPVTARCLLDVSGAKEGEWVAQTAAGSALGRQLVQMAKIRGIKTFCLVREARPDLVAQLKDLGADAVVQSGDAAAVKAACMEATGGAGCVACFDACAGDETACAAATLVPATFNPDAKKGERGSDVDAYATASVEGRAAGKGRPGTVIVYGGMNGFTFQARKRAGGLAPPRWSPADCDSRLQFSSASLRLRPHPN